jgi:hypothetical protein
MISNLLPMLEPHVLAGLFERMAYVDLFFYAMFRTGPWFFFGIMALVYERILLFLNDDSLF